jgi:long-chain acyl-CoA synthetase
MRDAKASVLPCVPAVLEFFARAIRQRAPGGWRGKMVRLALALMPMGMRRWSVTKLSGMPLGSLRAVICGGAFLPLELEDFWRGMGQPIIQGYGMTEAGPVVSVNRLKRPTRQSAGKLVENVEVRIADKNAEGIGEIQVKSPGVMKGYFKNEEATREAFTEDGWLRTGDLGYMDDKDELHVAGRLKDVIITGNGLNVYPEEVEAKLQEHPLVKMACVVQRPIAARGRRAERDGDQVWAAVVLDPEALEREMPQIMNDTKKLQELISQILAETNSRLAPYKRPAGADNWEELPLTRSGKVRRQKVREIYLKGGETEPVTP